MTRPPNPWSGTTPEAIWNNRMLDHVQSIRIVEGEGYRLKPGSKGTVLVIDKPTPAGAFATAVKIVSFDADFINCHSWDGANAGTTIIKVAKPTKLRSSITTETIDGNVVTYAQYDNVNQTRVATSPAKTEGQVIVPRYLVGDILYTIAAKTFVADSGVDTMDMNIDGRAWSAIPVAP